jgi:hypothetical protein
MTLHFPLPGSPGPSSRDRRSFVRLLLGVSLVGATFIMAGCESLKGQPVRNPYIHGGNGKDGRGGRS